VADANATPGDFSTIQTTGTLVPVNPVTPNVYTGLEATPVTYVGFLEATALNCPTLARVIEVTEPVVATPADFNIVPTPGNCTNVEETDDATQLSIQVLSRTPATADYAYSIEGTNSTFNIAQTNIVITGGFPFTLPNIELPASRTRSLTYRLRIVDVVRPTCEVVDQIITVPACPGISPPPLQVEVVPAPLVCSTDTVGTAVATITPSPDRLTLDYDFVVIPDTGTITPKSGTNITANTINFTGLEVGVNYVVRVLDNTDVRSGNGFQSSNTFSLTVPAALVITPNELDPTCNSNMPSRAIEFTVTEGTAPYTFTLRDDTGAIVTPNGGPVSPTVGLPPIASNQQTFVFTTSGDFTVEVEDDNGCMAELPINVMVPDAIDGNAVVTNRCLPETNPLDPSDPIEVEINITSGTPPFRYRIYEDIPTPVRGAYSTPRNINPNTIPIIDDTSITTEGDYLVDIIDATGCERTLAPFTINPRITVTNINRDEPECSPAVPPANPQARTEGLINSITLAGGAGAGSYTFEVAEISNSGDDPTSAFVDFPLSSFPYRFPESKAGTFFVFRSKRR